MALFTLAVAYSAYQGAGSLKPGSSPWESKTSGRSANANESARLSDLTTGADPFPTIGAGICRLTVNGEPHSPCGSCKAICPAEEFTDLIEHYFRAESGNDGYNLATPWKVPGERAKNIRFVVASLPDPVHTHMALLFDREIETIQKAAQASGYLFSRAWMPWDISTHPESTDFTVRRAQDQFRDQKESLPGLMIFQKSRDNPGETPDILFVFVVGETPTGGLRAEQFQNALNIRQSILADAGLRPTEKEATTLRIYGPAFSGSLISLDAILYAQKPRNRFSAIVIRSGSVSSHSAVRDFCESTRSEWPDPKPGPNSKIAPEASGRPDFATFQFTDQYQEYYLSVFFHDRHESHSHVAVLSEDETAFGNQEHLPGTPRHEARKRAKERTDAAQRAAKTSTTTNIEKEDEPTDPCPVDPPDPKVPLTRLYFPREIAQLRDAYQQNIKTQALTGTANPPPETRLPLSLGVTGNDDDSVAPYSPSQTPLSQESIMQAIVATLRKQHSKIVIIRAGDPLDMVFLARYLRQNYPQARVVTSGADLLMAYDVSDPRFHGILAVASYPLLNGVYFPMWSTEGPPEADKSEDADEAKKTKRVREVQRLFSDSFAVGGFNAFLSLLAADPSAPTSVSGPALDAKSGAQHQSAPSDTKPDSPHLPAAPCTQPECPALPPASYAQFGLPSFLRDDDKSWRPHLWLITVGRDGYWPVAVLDDKPFDDHQRGVRAVAVDRKPDPPEPYSVHFSVGWTIFWVITFGVTLLMIFLLLRPPMAFTRSEILGRFCETSSQTRNGLLFAGSMLLFFAQTLFVFPVIIWLKRFGNPGDHLSEWQRFKEYFEGMWLVWDCYIGSAVGLGLACYRRFKKSGNNGLARAGAFTCMGAGIAALALPWLIDWENLGNSLGNFVYRYVSVDSGVSPSLPLLFLLAAWIWWCWQSLTGVASTEEKHVVLPKTSDFDRTHRDANGNTEACVPEASDRLQLKLLAGKKNEWPWEILGTVPLDKKMTISAGVGLLAIVFLMRPDEIAEAFESTPYRWLYWILLYFCLLLVCYLVTHIVALWVQLRDVLRAIERAPFRRGFGELKNLTWKPLWKLAGSGRQEFVRLLREELDTLRRIQKFGALARSLTRAIRKSNTAAERLAAEYEKLLDGKDKNGTLDEVQRRFCFLQDKLASLVSEALIYASQQWKQESDEPSAAKSGCADDSKGKYAAVESPAKDPTLRAVEHFLCLFYLNVILVPLRRLQTLILAMAGVFVFVLISYSSYPFESRESFHALLIFIFFVISLVVGVVYGQMYSNPLLGRITNTKPGELGLDFWVRLGTFVFVPLLSLLSVQFPEINNFLFSWLQPALQSIK